MYAWRCGGVQRLKGKTALMMREFRVLEMLGA